MSDIKSENIKTIAVFDLETNGLPVNHTCAITELSIYAFSASCLMDTSNVDSTEPPKLPRVLHKLTLMINPGKDIHPKASEVSGLTNEMLSREARFDGNTAKCLLKFLKRLQAPICFVAHNGWRFDYPIINYVFNTVNMEIPSSIYCVDTLLAFREFDEKLEQVETIRRSSRDSSINDLFISNIRRTLFVEPFQPRTRFPAKGQYTLGAIFQRVFGRPGEDLHRAEADVMILTQLVLHYGLVFLAYVEERKQLFNTVPPL